MAPKATCRQVALKSPVQPKDLEATSIALLQGYSPVQQPLGPLPSSEWPKTYRQIRQRCASCTGGLKYSLFFLALFTSIYQCMHLARRIQFTTVDEAGFAVCKCCISRFSVGFLPIPWTLKICQVLDIMKPQSAAGMPLIIEGSELIEALALTSN